jgi:hypothetical protein
MRICTELDIQAWAKTYRARSFRTYYKYCTLIVFNTSVFFCFHPMSSLELLGSRYNCSLGRRTHGILSKIDVAHSFGENFRMNSADISSRIFVQKGSSTDCHEQFRPFFKIATGVELFEFFQSIRK